MTKPKAFIESFSYPGDTILTGNLPKNVDSYTIPYKYNRVKFTFASPTYENQENVMYSYKLEPFEENWRGWSQTAIKEYTNLREGNYVMKLKARNSYGIESNITEVEFTVSPPWYRHFLAYLFYLILVLLGAYLISIRIKLKIRKTDITKQSNKEDYISKENLKLDTNSMIWRKKLKN